jgi:galactokinase/mevalonate kinase-like predicted kinase
MKKLFSNYNFEFNKNEKKLITSFCKQALKQMSGEKQYFGEIKAFNSILAKLNENTEVVKLTKDEKIRLTNNIKQNVDYLKKQMDKSWFIKKWLMKSLYNQYIDIYEKHFKG